MGCSKCGKIKKTGKLSCCFSGGAWFKNCGDAGDTKFDHTWTDGVKACKGGDAPVPVTAKPSGACSKCGKIKKSGKLSCCAPGGAWFKNCGDSGNSKFDHTWTDGVNTCRGGDAPPPVTVQP